MGITSFAVVLACTFIGGADKIADSLHRTLNASGASVAQVQQSLWETLGAIKTSPRGVRVAGNAPDVEDLPLEALVDEVAEGALLHHRMLIEGIGPAPLRVSIPLPIKRSPGTARQNGAIRTAVFQRVNAGRYLEMDSVVSVRDNRLRFKAPGPGEYVVASVDRGSEKGFLAAIMPRYPAPSADPALRKDWRLFRMLPEVAVGPVPLLLIHGASTDRWGEFIHWAANSPEAGEFRQHYQIWNFRHLMAGINAAVGYDDEYTAFDESIIAYLSRFLRQAAQDGVETDGARYYWPGGPFAMMTNSHGGLKARAFMVNYPEYGDQVLACITLGGPHLGTPLATMEWSRYTVSRLGLGRLNLLDPVLEYLVSVNYFSTGNQSDLDIGWSNYDEAMGDGLPYKSFETWTRDNGWEKRVVSPRDANVAGARQRQGFEKDTTFEPKSLLPNWCGGMEQVMPVKRGDLYTDKLFLYGSYVDGWNDLAGVFQRGDDGVISASKNILENIGLRLTGAMMGLYASPKAQWPLAPYLLNDGFVPIQSQFLIQDDTDHPLYKTHVVMGWTLPEYPLQPDMDYIREHTLANPDRLRLFPGWSHLDTVTGRYNKETGHSELFSQVAEDLLTVLSAG